MQAAGTLQTGSEDVLPPVTPPQVPRDPTQQHLADLQELGEEDHVVQVDGINPYPYPHFHAAVFASLPLVPSVKTLLAMVAMPPVNSTMQAMLEDGVEVGGVEVAANGC